MIKDENLEHLQELAQKIKEGKGFLFLGAGASIPSGAPNSRQLVERLKEEFPRAQQSDDLNTLCDNIQYTEGYGWEALYKFVRSLLIDLKPSPAHEIMTHYDWAAIFTTNYDDLIEKAYSNPGRLKSLKAVVSPEESFSPFNRGICHLFKLNGCLRMDSEKEGAMVLTKTQLMGAIAERERIYEILLDVLKDGTIFFIGYSFEDLLASYIIQKAIKKFGINSIRYSYALFPNLNRLSQNKLQKLSQYRIIPIKSDFESFFSFLGSQFDHRSMQHDYMNDITLGIKGKEIILSSQEAQIYRNYFKILCEETIGQTAADKEAFFKGEDLSWGPYKEHWDFERFFYSKTADKPILKESANQEFHNLKQLVESKLESNRRIDFSKILVEPGIPGIGKTIIAKRLAFDFYGEGYPVIFLESNPRGFDIWSVIKFYRRIDANFVSATNSDSSRAKITLLIVVDNFADWIMQMLHLKEELLFHKYRALIIGFERIGVWNKTKRRIRRDLKRDIEELRPVAKQFHSQEKENLIQHLRSLQVLENDTLDLEEVESEEDTFFGLMYSRVHPAKVRFDEIIRNQYSSLSPKARDVFTIVCFFHQFALPVNYEFLNRIAGNLSWEILIDEIIHGEASGVIHEEEDQYRNLFYRTHHRIIAQKTIEFFCDDPEIKTQKLIQIFENANKDFEIEQDLCETIAINHLSRTKQDSDLSSNQLNRIFEKLCSNVPSSALFHHWALISKTIKDYERSHEHLAKAEALHDEERSQGKRAEKLSYIYTTWGALYAERGFMELKSENKSQAEKFFQDAEKRFEAAKIQNATNAPTYTAEAFMNLRRAKMSADALEKIVFLKKALELIDKAKSNVHPAELLLFEELSIEIQTRLQSIGLDKLERFSEILYRRFNSISGYYIFAETLISEARKAELPKEKKDLAKKALQVVDKALSYKANDGSLLKVKIFILEEFFPDQLLALDLYLQLLGDYYRNEMFPQFNLVFKFACLCFKSGYYVDSRRIFADLRKMMKSAKYSIKLRDEDERIFLGQIDSIKNDRAGFVRSSEPSIDYPIYFRPMQSKEFLRQGDLIDFNIIFTPFGVQAVNVKRR
ncbi:MAG: SIR2 family protein [Candidatus Heimdallarchaeota archaeon]